MSRLLELALKLQEVGLINAAKVRQVQVHQCYWLLRESGVKPSAAVEVVAERFEVSPDTVEAYSRSKDRFAPLTTLPENAAEINRPQS
jgi:hypothetical protein